MTTTPVLEDPFILDTDASDIAIGAALYQIQNGIERPVSFASHTLTPAQTRYCTTRKELLSIVVFTRHYKHYLLGREFTVRTDHGSLTWLFRCKHPECQLGRWLEELSQYAITIQHRAGVKHCIADGLSRIPEELDQCSCYEAGRDVKSLPCGGCPYCGKLHSQWDKFEKKVDYVVPLEVRQVNSPQNNTVHVGTTNDATDGDVEKNYMTQFSSQELRYSINWLEGEPPTQNDFHLQGIETRILWKCREQLRILHGVLYYRWVDDRGCSTLRLVVPYSTRNYIFQMIHDRRIGGHWGRDKTYAKLRQNFFWSSVSRHCQLFVVTCNVCHLSKGDEHNEHHQSTIKQGYPVSEST